MTAQTILNGRYPKIVAGLRSGNPYNEDISGDLSTWVSGSPTKGLSYAQRVMGVRGGVSPQPTRRVRSTSGGARSTTRVLSGRKQAAAAWINLAQNYAETGEVSNNAIARVTGAVSELGTVEPPVVKGQLPRSKPKGKGQFASGLADTVLAAAHTQVGKPYVFGSGPSTDSFDCSDLVQWAWGQAGVDIPRTTYEQMKVLPKKSWKDLSPGDLIYKNDGGHVVMYVGGGKVIAAPYTGTVVQYQPVSRFRSGNYHVRSVV